MYILLRHNRLWYSVNGTVIGTGKPKQMCVTRFTVMSALLRGLERNWKDLRGLPAHPSMAALGYSGRAQLLEERLCDLQGLFPIWPFTAKACWFVV